MRSNGRGLMLAALAFAGGAVAEPLVGPSVGNPDVLVSEGNRLYSTKKYAKAASKFLAATRANPTATQPYLVLARSYMGAKQVPAACNAYRAYLTAAPDSADRPKAERELRNCERRFKRVKKSKRIDLGPQYVETKAQFFAALDEKILLGSGSASVALRINWLWRPALLPRATGHTAPSSRGWRIFRALRPSGPSRSSPRRPSPSPRSRSTSSTAQRRFIAAGTRPAPSRHWKKIFRRIRAPRSYAKPKLWAVLRRPARLSSSSCCLPSAFPLGDNQADRSAESGPAIIARTLENRGIAGC